MTKRRRPRKIRRIAFIVAISAITLLLASALIPGGQGFLLFSHAAGTAPYSVVIANNDGTYTTPVNWYADYAGAKGVFDGSASPDTVIRDFDGKVIAMKRGMVIIRPPAAETLTLNPLTPGGKTTYVTKNAVTFYNSTSADGTTVTFPISGFTGTCSVDDVMLIPGAFIGTVGGTSSPTWKFDYYTNSGGNLVHYLSRYNGTVTNYSSITVDKAPGFMEPNTKYYSSDSLHYYTNPYDAAANKMSGSYVGLHAIYYQWVSYRTKTSYDATELDKYTLHIKPKKPDPITGISDSLYADKANVLFTYQNLYGVNAAMEMAFANLESAYGTSNIAQTKSNFFGIGAVDSQTGLAIDFGTFEECVAYHTRYVLSRGYFDAYAYINKSLPSSFYDVSDDTRIDTYYTVGTSYNGDFRYFGTYTGNKYSGVNVKYASDPYHGEKIAGIMYQMDVFLGGSDGPNDYDRYSIGLTNKTTYAYPHPVDDSTTALYKIAAQSTNHSSDYPVGMAVTILGESGNYYQIISDMPLKAYTDGKIYACNVWNYDHAVSIAYVRKDCITLVRNNLPNGSASVTSPTYTIDNTSKYISKIATNTTVANFRAGFANGSVRVYNGGAEVTSGNMKTGMRIEAYDLDGNLLTVYTAVVTGDVNWDGSVSISDLVQINRHLLGMQTITGASLKAADVNNSAAVTISDLVKLNRVLLGLDSITAY